MFRRAYEADTHTFLFLKNKKLLSVCIFVLINSSKHYGCLTKLIRKDEIIGMNKFEEGFMAGFLMNYRGKETEKEEKWQYPSDWLPLPEVGENEIAFLIFSEMNSNKNHTFSFFLSSYNVEDKSPYPDYIDMGNGTTLHPEGAGTIGTLSYTVGEGTPLNDKVEMYILKVHFNTSNCFEYLGISSRSGLYAVACNVHCSALATVDQYLTDHTGEVPIVKHGLTQHIEEGADGCRYLTYVKLNGDTQYFQERENFFNNHFSLMRVDFEIPPTKLNNNTFSNCYSLSDTNLPDLSKVTTLGTNIFNYCYKIKKLSLPSVTSVPYNCFSHMNNLEEIDLENATDINSGNFSDFYNLSKVNIPRVSSMHGSCFSGSKITKLSLPGIKTISGGFFNNMYHLEEIYLDNLTSINYSSFMNCYCLSKIHAPSLNSIGNSCFTYTNIKELYLPSINSIGSGSFNYNEALTTVDLPSLKTLGDCFCYDYNLAIVSVPSLETSGNSFQACFDLKSIDLSSLITLTSNAIGNYCYFLENIIAPNIDISLSGVFPHSYMIKTL